MAPCEVLVWGQSAGCSSLDPKAAAAPGPFCSSVSGSATSSLPLYFHLDPCGKAHHSHPLSFRPRPSKKGHG